MEDVLGAAVGATLLELLEELNEYRDLKRGAREEFEEFLKQDQYFEKLDLIYQVQDAIEFWLAKKEFVSVTFTELFIFCH